jgi:hypothetical protein
MRCMSICRLLIGADRKWVAGGQIDAFDPIDDPGFNACTISLPSTMLSFSERGGWSFIKLTWKVQSRPILELKHSRVRMITDFRFNLYNSTCEGSRPRRAI